MAYRHPWPKNSFLLQYLFIKMCKNVSRDVGLRLENETLIIQLKLTVLVEQGCTTQISWRAKKVLLKHSRARLVVSCVHACIRVCLFAKSKSLVVIRD